MNDHAAFLAAIIAEPDVDLPRLVYADWLDERGQGERAEFIRVQCELARADDSWQPPAGMSPASARDALRGRERELLKNNVGAWVDFLPESMTARQCHYCEGQGPDWETGIVECRQCESTGLQFNDDNFEFRRGFVADVTLSWQDWLANHQAILDSCPIKNAKDGLVRLTTWPTTFGVPINRDAGGTLHLIGQVYPGVRFVLPPAGQALLMSHAQSPADFDYSPAGRGYFTNAELERMHRENNEAMVLNFLRTDYGVQDAARWHQIETRLTNRESPFLEHICECQYGGMGRSFRSFTLQSSRVFFGGFHWQVFIGTCPDCNRVLHTRPTRLTTARP